MSDADDQTGGSGGNSGNRPQAETDDAPDDKSGNIGTPEDNVGKEARRTGQGQAATNRDDDPPA